METKNVLYYIFSVVRLLLYPFALLYGALMWLRNRLYDAKFFSSVEFSVPVIVVGNLSTGGTGKTPHVEYLVRLLQYRFKVATLSRGYKRHTQGFLMADEHTNALRIGDEPMQYFMKFPELAVAVAEDRMTGIPGLLQRRPDIEVVLLDDAYQHRSVRAGLSILITDYSKPFYADHILPFGSLREGGSASKRADIVVVSKCPANLGTADAAQIKKLIAALPHQQVFFTAIQYDAPFDLITREQVQLNGRHIILVCGIARPEPLLAHLKESAANVHTLSYRDHHYFVTADLEEIRATYDNWNVTDKIIVTTEKDATRLYLHFEKLKEWGVTIAVLPIKIEVLFNHGDEFDTIVTNYVEKAVAENNEIFGSNA